MIEKSATAPGAPEQGTSSGTTPDQPRSHPAPLGPSRQRVASLDFMRGIAVLGILAANIVAFGQPMLATLYPAGMLVPQTEAGDIAMLVQLVLVDGKMRGLFAILFGAGVVLFLERARASGAGDTLQLRRLAWLFAFGMAHYFLLWRGDILALYAVCGLIAMPCADWKPKTQMTVGLIVYVLSAVFLAVSMGGLYAIVETSFGATPDLAESRAAMAGAVQQALTESRVDARLIMSGDYPGFVAHNVVEHGPEWGTSALISAFEIVPLMLIGMALYRIGVFEGRTDAARQRLWGWVGLIAGTLLTILVGLWWQDAGFGYYASAFVVSGLAPLARLPATLGLTALLALWGLHANGWLARRFSAAGRMAFSNYIGTSVLMVVLFHGWAFGLFGRLDRVALYMIVPAVWVLMLAWSKPWLDRYRYGPLEWLWRCLTYWQRFPLRKGTEAATKA